jgi:hypothetical protein
MELFDPFTAVGDTTSGATPALKEKEASGLGGRLSAAGRARTNAGNATISGTRPAAGESPVPAGSRSG